MKLHRRYPLSSLSVVNTTTLLLLMGCAGVGRKPTESPIEFDATPTSVDGYLAHLSYDENTSFEKNQELYDVDIVEGPAEITFSLEIEDAELASLIEIDPQTGVITAVDDFSLDYEDGDEEFKITVVASTQRQEVRQTIKLSINDINDDAPTFSASPADLSSTINENSQYSTQFQALPDAALDGITIRYSLSGNDAHFFDIDVQTGELTAKSDTVFDHESGKTEYELTILATTYHVVDGLAQPASYDGEELVTELEISISVTDLNDVAPTIDSSGTGTALAENTEILATTTVYTAEGTPDVEGDSITWSLKDNNNDDAGLFDIGSSSGVVTFKSATTPDHESGKTSYAFTIVATTGNLSSEKDVTIAVTDVNDMAPVFAQDTQATITVSDRTTTFDAVTYQAVPDVASVAVTYAIEAITGKEADIDDFTIDATTGVLTAASNAEFVHETKSSYEFNIVATAGSQTATQKVVVTVAPIEQSNFLSALPGNKGDVIFGEALGNEFLQGTGLSDIIIGGAGNDTLYSGRGNDTLIGGKGEDKIILDSGKDIVVITFNSNATASGQWALTSGQDVIDNFHRGQDKIIFVDENDTDQPILSLNDFLYDDNSPLIRGIYPTGSTWPTLDTIVIEFQGNDQKLTVNLSTENRYSLPKYDEEQPTDANNGFLLKSYASFAPFMGGTDAVEFYEIDNLPGNVDFI